MNTRTVGVLSASQVVSWGTLYSAFPVMASAIETEGRWSRTSVGAAFWLLDAAIGIAGGILVLVVRRPLGRRLGLGSSAGL